MTSLPPELQYGHVVGRVILAVADTGDADTYPDAVPAQGTVTFTPKNPEIRVGEPDPVVVLKQKIVCTIDSAGYVTDPDGKRGVWLVTGVYTVSYTFNAAALPAHDIVVGPEHTLASPLDLTLAMPPGGPVLQPSQYAELTARIDSLVFEAAGVSSVNGATGAVVLDADDVGALPSSYTPPAPSWASVTGKPATFPPTIGTTATTAKAGNWTPTKADVGLANVDNTSDANKPVSTATQTALDGKAATSHTHTAANISDATTVGRNVLKATDAAAARTAIGAGTSNLTIGTTASTAKAGNYVPTWSEVTSKPATFTPAAHTHAVGDVTGLQSALDTAGAPQTISLSGSDLTLSDGGGTVTLPSGGGGGGAEIGLHLRAGDWARSIAVYDMQNYTLTLNSPVAVPIRLSAGNYDRISIKVRTASAGGVIRLGIINGATEQLIADLGTVNTDVADTVTATGPFTVTTDGWHLAVVTLQGSPAGTVEIMRGGPIYGLSAFGEDPQYSVGGSIGYDTSVTGTYPANWSALSRSPRNYPIIVSVRKAA